MEFLLGFQYTDSEGSRSDLNNRSDLLFEILKTTPLFGF